MIASLKSNKRERPNTFKKMKNFEGGKYSEIHFNKKATPSQLKRLKEKIQEENRRAFKKKVIYISIFAIVVIYFIGFYKF